MVESTMETSGDPCPKNVEKKEIPPNMQKICLVCGDKALGYNFNVISCESCKAFFRRNALASKEFKCPFTNHCDITVVTRRFCQKCRLEKCFSVGMVKEFIMSEEDKAEKRRKIEENRAKKRHHNISDDAVSSSKNVKLDDEVTQSEYLASAADSNIIQYDVLSTTYSPSSTAQSPLSHDLDSSINSSSGFSQPHSLYVPAHSTDQPYTMKVYPVDDKAQITQELMSPPIQEQFSNSNSVDHSIAFSDSPKQNSIRSILTSGESPPAPAAPSPPRIASPAPPAPPAPAAPQHAEDETQETQDGDQDALDPSSIQCILSEAVKLEFAAQPATPSAQRDLNEVELARLSELVAAHRALNAPIDNDVERLAGDAHVHTHEAACRHDPRLITLVNITAIAIRRLIKMAKRIHAFKNMCEEDQVALLKGGCIEMMILRSTMTYDGQQDRWKLPHSGAQFGSIRADVLKLASGDVYRAHERLLATFPARWRHDERLILLLSAVLLFCPDRHNLVHTDVIRLEQGAYFHLLRRYLEARYAGCEARAAFLRLLAKLRELRSFAALVTGVYLDVSPLEPLLVEIFDLNHRAA